MQILIVCGVQDFDAFLSDDLGSWRCWGTYVRSVGPKVQRGVNWIPCISFLFRARFYIGFSVLYILITIDVLSLPRNLKFILIDFVKLELTKHDLPIGIRLSAQTRNQEPVLQTGEGKHTLTTMVTRHPKRPVKILEYSLYKSHNWYIWHDRVAEYDAIPSHTSPLFSRVWSFCKTHIFVVERRKGYLLDISLGHGTYVVRQTWVVCNKFLLFDDSRVGQWRNIEHTWQRCWVLLIGD